SRAATALRSWSTDPWFVSILPPVMVQALAARLATMPPASALQRGLADMVQLLKMKPSLGGRGRMRCHDLAQFGSLAGACRPAQRVGREPEERAEPRREVAVARESGVERDRGEVEVRIQHGVERLRQAQANGVAIHGGSDFLVED